MGSCFILSLFRSCTVVAVEFFVLAETAKVLSFEALIALVVVLPAACDFFFRGRDVGAGFFRGRLNNQFRIWLSIFMVLSLGFLAGSILLRPLADIISPMIFAK